MLGIDNKVCLMVSLLTGRPTSLLGCNAVVLGSPLQLKFFNSSWLHTGKLSDLIAYHTAEPTAAHSQVQPALHYQGCLEKQQKVGYSV